MARGNWQRRVELNESRRNEAKQKKLRNEERKIFKSQIQGLISLLDQHTDAIGQSGRHRLIHIWSDTLPSDAPPVLDLWEEEATKHHSKRELRSRSTSIESEKAARTPTSCSKKKPHPRSKEAMNVETEDEAVNTPKLCRSYFFSGKCESSSSKKGGGKKGQGGSCRYVHYPKKYNTLADVVLLNATTRGDSSIGMEAAALSEASYPECQSGGESTSHADAMDMVYYISLDLKEFSLQAESSDLSAEKVVKYTLGEWVVDAMASRACSTGSIVYFMLDNQLLYDRYRDGIVLDDATLRGSSTPCADGTTNTLNMEPVVLLPGPLLEYVLTFLGDTAVASMSMVCSSWNQEIGKQSSSLWSFLLHRRSWPIPEVMQGNDTDYRMPILRDAFLSHYKAVRDMAAIKAGICRLLSPTSATRNKSGPNDREGCYRSFDSLQGAPQECNPCIALNVWSPNRVLAAYSQDCTLRLFDSVQRSGCCGQRLCREIVCLRIDPYKNTRKRACRMLSLALDDVFIGCLLHVVEDSSESEAYVLAVLSREDFLIDNDTAGDDIVQVIDIRVSVLNFLVSCDEVDHGLLQLNDFLSEDGDVDDVEVLVSRSVASCGFGRFMVEVSVSIPLGTDEEDSDANMTLLFRKLIIFSASVGAIVWMCDSNPSSVPLRPRHEEFTLVAVKTELAGPYGWYIAAPSCASFGSGIMCGSIDSIRNVSYPTLLQGSNVVGNDILRGSWNIRWSHHRPVVIAGNNIIAADNLVQENENGTKRYKSFLSCYPIAEGTNRLAHEIFQLQDNLEVCHLTAFRNDHVLAICRLFETNPGVSDDDEVDGQWFGVGETTLKESSCAIIIDIHSKCEIHRVCLVDDLVSQIDYSIVDYGELPIRVAVVGDTVAAGLWWKGITLTGSDVRHDRLSERAYREEASILSARKKKKKPQKKNAKKDGFARGMSLRG